MSTTPVHQVPQVWLKLDRTALNFGAVCALHPLSVEVCRGEALALVGANGSGKSSLLRLMHGLVAASSGVRTVNATLRQSMVFQRPFMMRASVLSNLGMSAFLQGARWADRKAVAAAALTRVGMADLAQRQARSLSGGQQQRLAIARAIAMQPDMLLLDEPTASLAPAAKRDVEQLMADCHQSGMGVVFASHNLGQVKRLAQRVLWLDAGVLRFDGSTQDFFNLPMVAHGASAATLFMEHS